MVRAQHSQLLDLGVYLSKEVLLVEVAGRQLHGDGVFGVLYLLCHNHYLTSRCSWGGGRGDGGRSIMYTTDMQYTVRTLSEATIMYVSIMMLNNFNICIHANMHTYTAH